MGGIVSEPGWKQELRDTVDVWVGDPFQAPALEALMPHIEAAYQRGLVAGRSQTGYRTTRKKKEAPCPPPPSAPGATGSTPASAGEPPEGAAP